jgi:hypothetical protein
MINITANYAYRLTFKDDSKLAYGLNVTVNNFNGRWSEASLQNIDDPSFSANSSLWNPNFGFGGFRSRLSNSKEKEKSKKGRIVTSRSTHLQLSFEG